MQDQKTGELHGLTEEEANEIELFPRQENTPENKDLIFRVGEKVKIKGGMFRISSIGKKKMVVEGIPGTRMKQ